MAPRNKHYLHTLGNSIPQLVSTATNTIQPIVTSIALVGVFAIGVQVIGWLINGAPIR